MLSFDSTELDKGQIQTLKKLGLTLESVMNESAISLDKLKLVNSISIQGNPNKHFEAEFGKDIQIPAYPKEGDVTFKKKKIGFISNWNGLVITDMEWIKDNIDKLQNIVKKTGMWYNF